MPCVIRPLAASPTDCATPLSPRQSHCPSAVSHRSAPGTLLPRSLCTCCSFCIACFFTLFHLSAPLSLFQRDRPWPPLLFPSPFSSRDNRFIIICSLYRYLRIYCSFPSLELNVYEVQSNQVFRLIGSTLYPNI